MPIKLLHHKCWHVYKKDNVERVRKDEAKEQARLEEEERLLQENDFDDVVSELRGTKRKPEDSHDDVHSSAKARRSSQTKIASAASKPSMGKSTVDKHSSDSHFGDISSTPWYAGRTAVRSGPPKALTGDPLLDMRANLARKKALSEQRDERDRKRIDTSIDDSYRDRYNPTSLKHHRASEDASRRRKRRG